eukprot:scaffold229099_cov32-Tisochrysis_lutea.AAC.2
MKHAGSQGYGSRGRSHARELANEALDQMQCLKIDHEHPNRMGRQYRILEEAEAAIAPDGSVGSRRADNGLILRLEAIKWKACHPRTTRAKPNQWRAVGSDGYETLARKDG